MTSSPYLDFMQGLIYPLKPVDIPCTGGSAVIVAQRLHRLEQIPRIIRDALVHSEAHDNWATLRSELKEQGPGILKLSLISRNDELWLQVRRTDLPGRSEFDTDVLLLDPELWAPRATPLLSPEQELALNLEAVRRIKQGLFESISVLYLACFPDFTAYLGPWLDPEKPLAIS